MKKAVIGILAHVDAGKTTLAESMLYTAGTLRSLGRVDSGSTALDTHALERERGITIFTGQAAFTSGELSATLLDTPGHVDFSSETERTIQVLDCALLVISGTDTVQSHTVTLWNLLRLYSVPTFIFVTKMDQTHLTKDEIMERLRVELDPNCVDFTAWENPDEEFNEQLALCCDEALEKFSDGSPFSPDDISGYVSKRALFPCLFGSGLRCEGISGLLDLLEKLIPQKSYPSDFGAKVFKISHDKELRLAHLKVTGGTLRVRDALKNGDGEEKVSQIRIYSGAKYETADCVEAGCVCTVAGLAGAESGTGYGTEAASAPPVFEPVMTFRVMIPEGQDAQTMLVMLKKLEEEEPSLHVGWDSFRREIHVGLMGEVQAEILRSLIAERFGVQTEIDSGRVRYMETVDEAVEGVGHYEPLRHYAEVHVIIEPMPRGSGISFESRCSENSLDRNWQRLILTHLKEKEHLGVLTGAPLTDVKFVLAAGRAHLKHTEGGDFRQATYRAVRQGLMNAESRLLEPYCTFRLEVPFEQVGRAINDIRMRSGVFETSDGAPGFAVVSGRAPVSTMNGYAMEVTAYTSGRGRFTMEVVGYDICHDSEKVIELAAYDPEADLENTPDSVFCAHGGGFAVKWNRVTEYMHLESCLEKEPPFVPAVNHRNLHIDDKELQAIMEREFGPVKYELYRPVKREENPAEETVGKTERKKWLIVDGYNVIFAWQDLSTLAAEDLSGAREKLMHILSNYAAFTKMNVVLVFDAYKVPGSRGEKFDFQNIHVVYTKERELGDVYIEKMVSEIGKNDSVRVVSSDALIQLSAVRFGVLRESAAEFEREVDAVHEQIGEYLDKIRSGNPSPRLGDSIPDNL